MCCEPERPAEDVTHNNSDRRFVPDRGRVIQTDSHSTHSDTPAKCGVGDERLSRKVRTNTGLRDAGVFVFVSYLVCVIGCQLPVRWLN